MGSLTTQNIWEIHLTFYATGPVDQ
jgi:hypothetical protein